MHRREVINLMAAGAGGLGFRSAAASPSQHGSERRARKGVEGQFVEARDGTRLYWKKWGSGRPMLFLHSWSLTSQMWDFQTVAFARQGFACYAFDCRGHGKSDQSPEGYDYDTFADDIAAVVEALDLEHLTVVCHSMACGQIARYLTRHGSARVERVVMLGTMTPFLLRSADNPNGIPATVFEGLRAGWRRDFPRWVVDNAPPFFSPETSPAMIQWGTNMMFQCSLPVAIACNEALTSTDFRGDLAKITVPTLVIHGDRDASAPLALTGKPTADLIRGCRFKMYEGAPHGLCFTHVDQVNADILQFIRETSA